MTEDILCAYETRRVDTCLTYLVDNVFVGHDAAAAKKFAGETYHVKKPIEQEAEGSSADEDDEEPSTMLDKVRLRVYEFIRESHSQQYLPRI